jgi:hypothetical protein
MWYLPVIDHLKHVFFNPRDVELVHWHSEKCRKNNEEIRHPADGTQWKNFYLQYKSFGSKSENIKFALSTDGMNPFSKNMTVHVQPSDMVVTKESILYCLFLSKV